MKKNPVISDVKKGKSFQVETWNNNNKRKKERKKKDA